MSEYYELRYFRRANALNSDISSRTVYIHFFHADEVVKPFDSVSSLSLNETPLQRALVLHNENVISFRLSQWRGVEPRAREWNRDLTGDTRY